MWVARGLPSALRSLALDSPRPVCSEIQCRSVTNLDSASDSEPIRPSSSTSSASTSRSTSTPSTSSTSGQYPWINGRVSNGYWNDPEHQKVYMEWLGEQLGFLRLQDWYKVTQVDFYRNHGRGLFSRHGRSPSAVVASTFPDYIFLPWLFHSTPHGFFDLKLNRLKYVSWLMDKVGVKDFSELKLKHFEENAGIGLAKKYAFSPQKIVESLELDSDPSIGLLNRSRKPHNFLDSLSNQRAFLDGIGRKIGVSEGTMVPWYSLKASDLVRWGGSGILNAYGGSVSSMLKAVYPEHEWQPWKFAVIPKEYLRTSNSNLNSAKEPLSSSTE